MWSTIRRHCRAETRSHWALEEMDSTWTAMEEQLTAAMGSRHSTSTRVNRDSNNQFLKDSHPSKTLLVAEPQTRSRTTITSKTQDKIQICRTSSNLMGIVYLIISSSNRPARGRSLMDRICCKNLTRARRGELKKHRKFNQSQRMHTLNYRSRWELNKQSSLRTSLSIKKIFWNSLIVMKYMQN